MTLATLFLIVVGLLLVSASPTVAAPMFDHDKAVTAESAAVVPMVHTPVARLVSLVPPYSAATPLPQVGRAMYYNPGVMGEVLAYRLQRKQVDLCFECVGYAALLRAGDLNRRIWLQWENGEVDGPFLVIDVAAHHHIPSLLERNWVVDVDYRSAMRRGMNRPLPVTVLSAPPIPVEPAVQPSLATVSNVGMVRDDGWACEGPRLRC